MTNGQFKILLVDDEKDVREFLSYNLLKEGYKVETAKNGTEAIATAKKFEPHLIILDVMMPGMDGIEACNTLREDSRFKNTIIVFLTARGEDYSQIAGFDAGADDYITKPIKPKVLMSRVKALLRRHKQEAETSGRSEFKNFIIDKERYVVIIDEKEVSLPRKEFELLDLLTSKPNKVFTRQEIFSKVWGDSVIVGDRTIDVHIRKIREKLKLDSIKTVKGVGYKFESQKWK
jgi:two-component system alkaline phosphatase synthesis response regulator PhoP